MIFSQVLKIGTPVLTHAQIRESSHLLVTNAGGTSTAIVPAGGAMAAGDVELMGQVKVGLQVLNKLFRPVSFFCTECVYIYNI
jgi:hypothetical protein